MDTQIFNVKIESKYVILLSILLLIANCMPCFGIGFYQDDYHSFLLLTKNYGILNYGQFIADNPLNLGMRPLVLIPRIIYYDLFGDNVVLHRLYLLLIKIIYALLVYKITFYWSKSTLTSYIALLLFSVSSLTNQIVFRLVAFSEPTLISFFILFLFLRCIHKHGRLHTKHVSIIVILTILGLSMSESGITCLAYIFLLLLLYIRKLKTYNLVPLLISAIATFILYISLYIQFTQSNQTGKTVQNAKIGFTNIYNVSFGLFKSIMAPLADIYNCYRNLHEIGNAYVVPLVIFLLILLFLSFLIKTGFNLNTFTKIFLKNINIKIILILLMGSSLFFYVFISYFDHRMLVNSFPLGIILWSLFIGDFLEYTDNNSAKKLQSNNSLIYVAFLSICFIGYGSPISQKVVQEYRTAEKLKETIIKFDNAEKFQQIYLMGFPSKGPYLRNHNAYSLVKYFSSSPIKEISNKNEIDNSINSLFIEYNENHKSSDYISYTLINSE